MHSPRAPRSRALHARAHAPLAPQRPRDGLRRRAALGRAPGGALSQHRQRKSIQQVFYGSDRHGAVSSPCTLDSAFPAAQGRNVYRQRQAAQKRMQIHANARTRRARQRRQQAQGIQREGRQQPGGERPAHAHAHTPRPSAASEKQRVQPGRFQRSPARNPQQSTDQRGRQCAPVSPHRAAKDEPRRRQAQNQAQILRYAQAAQVEAVLPELLDDEASAAIDEQVPARHAARFPDPAAHGPQCRKAQRVPHGFVKEGWPYATRSRPPRESARPRGKN